MKSALFFDIEILIKSSPNAWIIDKKKPNFPIVKIDISDFNIFKSGVLKSQGNRIDFNGKIFWVSTDFMNLLKIKCKKYKSDISNLGISMQEYLNPELTKDSKFQINKDISSKIDSKSDVYIICSKNKRDFFKNHILQLESFLSNRGIKIKKYYYTSETFFNKKDDLVSYTKSKIIIQHLLGMKCENDILTDERISQYDEITYFDDDKKSIQSCILINSTLEKLISKSDDFVKKCVKDIIKSNDPRLICKEYTHNKSNKFLEKEIKISYPNLIKKFENYNY